MKIKILHIQVLPKLSGVQRVSLEIFKQLDNLKYDKYILFGASSDCGDTEYCINEFKKAGVKVLFSNNLKREIGFFDILLFKEIYHLCRAEKFDIVHTNSTKPGIVGRIAAYMAKTPFVIHTVHGLAFHKFVKFPKWQFYWLCEMIASCFCHHIVVVNKYYTKYFRWCKDKVSTIYNGIDYSRLAVPSHRYDEKRPLQVLFVGRLDRPKNPLMLLEVARLIHNILPSVQFRLVGDGEYMCQCRQFVSENNLEDCIQLLGWQTDVGRFYMGSDVFAAPSIYEAFGLMFLEAGYYKLPVCSTAVEGIPEVVENNVTGILCAPNDIETFTHNLLHLLQDKQLRHQMGENGYNRVTKLFNSKKMVGAYVALYENKGY